MKENRTNLGYRKCTKADFDRFYESNASSKKRIVSLINDEVLYCLNGLTEKGEEIELTIWG